MKPVAPNRRVTFTSDNHGGIDTHGLKAMLLFVVSIGN